MQFFQKDIVGGGKTLSTQKAKKVAEKTAAKRVFPEINLNSGLNDKEAEGNAMLVHRMLQKKLMYANLRDSQTFLKILENEVGIKTGVEDSVTATRDSLIAFFAKNVTRN